MEKTREELINNLIEISYHKDILWKYHEDNPNRLDLEDEYQTLVEKENLIKTQL